MRTKEIKIRVTDDEYQELIIRKTNPRLAVWLRELALDQKPTSTAKPVNKKLLFELNKIGANLNQIARRCNEQKTSPIDLININLSLGEISEMLKKVKDDC